MFHLFRAPDTPNWRRQTSWRWLWNTSGTCRDSRWLVSKPGPHVRYVYVWNCFNCRWCTFPRSPAGTLLVVFYHENWFQACFKIHFPHSFIPSFPLLSTLFIHLLLYPYFNIYFIYFAAAVNTDPSVLGKYRAGFSECVGEVTRFLSTCEGVNTDVRTRLLSHLAACVTQINAVNFYTPHPGALGLRQTTSTQIPPMPCKSDSAMPVSSGAMKMFGGFQVMPTPDGQFAFLVPSAALVPLQNSQHTSPVAPPLTSDSVWRPW